MTIIYKLSWLFLRSLERGGVSELGLAQSEDSFQLSSTTKLKTKRTVTSRVDCLLETVFQSQGRRNVPEGKRKL
jgi:hypothetical protein